MVSPKLASALKASKGCLFLCSGNIIRSAFAELYAVHRGLQLPVRSAGTTYPNRRIYPEARRALLDRGVPARVIDQFRPQLIADLDPPERAGELVFGMTRDHLKDATAQGLGGDHFLLTELVSANREIADPYFEGGFDGVFDDITLCIDSLVESTS